MVEHGAKREQCVLFPGGIELPPRHAAEELEEFRRKHKVAPGQKLVSYLGTVERRKNVLAIVRVARALKERPDVTFAIAGRMEGEYAKGVAAESKETPNVAILGEISDEEKSLLIRASYLNINMSELEALGLAQLEFMSAGVPVVTSGVGGQAWVVKNGVSGAVLEGPKDVEGATSAIERLLDDPAYRDRLGGNAERFASKLTMGRLVRKLATKLQGMREVREFEVLTEGPSPKRR